ncbi:MAG: porphobilinogen synthase [Bacillota bacterium]
MFERFRTQRTDEGTRLQFRETFLRAADFILPLFIVSGFRQCREISGLPGVNYYSADMLQQALAPLIKMGLQSVLLFPVPDSKGIEATYSEHGLVQQASRVLKIAYPGLELISDVCLCAYTVDGHCHIGDNDNTCRLLARIAVSHAAAGVDIVAPSDMMDGRVWFIRQALTESGYATTKIMAYAAKYASNFYGPFRAASQCGLASGADRKTYQMDYCNSNQALAEIAADVAEGADQIIVKPALSYLDIIARAKTNCALSLVAYNVSGEYLMLKNAITQGVVAPDAVNETLIAMKRAGATRIISYFTPEILLNMQI